MLVRLGMRRTGTSPLPPPDPAKFPPMTQPLEALELAAPPMPAAELCACPPPLPLVSPLPPQAEASTAAQATRTTRFTVQPSKETRPPDFFPLTTPDHRGAGPGIRSR